MKQRERLVRKASRRLLACVAAATLAAPAGAMEIKVFAIGDFVPSGSGGCGGGDRGHWPDMVDAWYDRMAVHGHSKDGQYTDGNMTIRRFCDPDWLSGCQDHYYVDEADASMIATHGSDSGDHWAGTMRYPWSGHCALDGGGTSDDLHVGDYDLEFIHFSSCYSADDDNLNPSGSLGVREAMWDPDDSPVNHRYAHLLTGNHGIMYIRGKYDDDYNDFAHDAHSVGMAYAWVTNSVHFGAEGCAWYDPFNWFDTCQDICPVAVSQGQNQTRAWQGIQYERYNNVYPDPSDHGWWYWMGYPGCDPVGETAFNP